MKICKVRDDSRRKIPLHTHLLIAPVGEDYSDEEEAKAVSADWDFYRFASKSFISPLGLSVQFIKYQVSDLGWVDSSTVDQILLEQLGVGRKG